MPGPGREGAGPFNLRFALLPGTFIDQDLLLALKQALVGNQVDPLQGNQQGGNRFPALVLVDPSRHHTIETGTAGKIEKSLADIVAAEKPVKSPFHFAQPVVIAAQHESLVTGIDHGGCIDRLLVVAGLFPAAPLPAVVADQRKGAPFRAGLDIDQPLQAL